MIVPAEGGVETCTLIKWMVRTGDPVSVGEHIAVVETDKATMDIISPVEGYLLEQVYEQGDTAPTLVPIAFIGERPGEVSNPWIQRIGASPRSKRRAREFGIDMSNLRGTGQGGNIVERDVLLAAQQKRPNVSEAVPSVAYEREALDTEAYKTIALDGIRRLASERLMHSMQNTVQYTLNMKANAESLLLLRKRMKEDAELCSVTLGDMVMWATAKALTQFGRVNSVWVEGIVRQYRDVNLGMAVHTERGLIVPVIASANRLSLLELSREAKRLAEATRRNELAPSALQNGTFTVTNLGPHGITSFTPVLNYPQVGILGVSKLDLYPEHDGSGIRYVDKMTLSLTVDHQIIDGAYGAEFLGRVSEIIEHFTLALAE